MVIKWELNPVQQDWFVKHSPLGAAPGRAGATRPMGQVLPRAGLGRPKEKTPSQGYDNTPLPPADMHRLHCYQLLVQYSSKYVQI